MVAGNALSIVVPTLNEAGNITLLVSRIDAALRAYGIPYEVIFIDDHSSDETVKEIASVARKYPVSCFEKIGQRGKAFSLLEGFAHARYDLIAILDADLQYPPEALPQMVFKIDDAVSVVVANRNEENLSFIRKLYSKTYQLVFGRLLHGMNIDMQSGMKVFRKEIIERIRLHPTAWTFDLEFLVKAQHAGYGIGTVTIPFGKRNAGSTKVSLFKDPIIMAYSAVKTRFDTPDVIPLTKSDTNKEGYGFHFKGNKYVPHFILPLKESALIRMTMEQVLIIWCAILAIILALLINWHITLIALLVAITAFYTADLGFSLYLILRSLSTDAGITITTIDVVEQHKRRWPMYTILCPLYKEWAVLPQFIEAIAQIDYPKDRLQVMLLLEEDDKETINRARQMQLPGYFTITVVPHSKPKTKPKACNYGLRKAKGEYVVIYDAEDVPEPQQLKKAVLAFEQAPDSVKCIQAKLNYYNPKQNFLTKLFTAEYSLWFDLVLPGLQLTSAPIPLGGTSNHFRRQDLLDLGGWDAFNVTEDCDLGMRMAKRGYHTEILNSTTLEEANSSVRNWFTQRTRWIKGYMQSYIVHMRDFDGMVTRPSSPRVLLAHLTVGGKILSLFINPLMWAITITYFALRPFAGPFIESLFPPIVLYLAVTSLVFGNFLYLYYYMIGLAKRNRYDIMEFVYLVPLYWIMMSLAGWIALYQLILKPHYWSKTVHGLHLQDTAAQKFPVFGSVPA